MPNTLDFLSKGLLTDGGVPISLKSELTRIVGSGDPQAINYFTPQELLTTFSRLFKVVSEQILFNPRGGWNDELAQIFMMDGNRAGAFTTIFGTDADPNQNMEIDGETGTDGTSNPWQGGPKKAKIGTSNIVLNEGVRWILDRPTQELRAAFLDENRMQYFMAELIGTLNDKAGIYLRKHVIGFMEDCGKEYVVPVVELSDTAASRLFWQYQAEKMGCTCCLVRDRCLSEHDRCSARKLEYGYFMPQRRKNLER